MLKHVGLENADFSIPFHIFHVFEHNELGMFKCSKYNCKKSEFSKLSQK